MWTGDDGWLYETSSATGWSITWLELYSNIQSVPEPLISTSQRRQVPSDRLRKRSAVFVGIFTKSVLVACPVLPFRLDRACSSSASDPFPCLSFRPCLPLPDSFLYSVCSFVTTGNRINIILKEQY